MSLDHKCAKAYSGRALIYSHMASAELRKAAEIDWDLRVTLRHAPASIRERDKADELANVKRAEAASYRKKANELHRKCIDDASEAIAADPHLATAYLTRALAYAVQQVPDKALADFAAAIREDPKMVKAYFNRGVFLFNQHQYDAAIKDFEEASKLQPNSARIYQYLYLAYQEEGDSIFAAKYNKLWQEKQARQTGKNSPEFAGDFNVKLKTEPELQPDAGMDSLDKAKKELENKLDATAQR